MISKKPIIITVFTWIAAICVLIANPLPVSAQDIHDAVVTSDPTETVLPTNDLFVQPHAVNAVRYLKLRIMLGATYRDDYSDYLSEASARVSYVDIPFLSTWSIGFTESFTNIGNLCIDYCSLSRLSGCTDAQCGSNCNNDIDNLIHHKNSIKNLNKIRNDISDGGYDIMMTLVSNPMCGIWGSVHATNILGVTYLKDNYTLLTNSSIYSENVRVRIMQHEISHMFGCRDGVCTAGADCIMNGGYDGVSLYTSNIWCSSCHSDFDTNAQ